MRRQIETEILIIEHPTYANCGKDLSHSIKVTVDELALFGRFLSKRPERRCEAFELMDIIFYFERGEKRSGFGGKS